MFLFIQSKNNLVSVPIGIFNILACFIHRAWKIIMSIYHIEREVMAFHTHDKIINSRNNNNKTTRKEKIIMYWGILYINSISMKPQHKYASFAYTSSVMLIIKKNQIDKHVRSINAQNFISLINFKADMAFS